MDFKAKIKRLIEEEFKPLGIKDERVLSAFLEVPRHEFVPKQYWTEAYLDHPLPIGFRQTISQPSLVALMTQALELKGDEKVLEVGTGSGFQAAILSKLAKEVYTIERIKGLAKVAKNNLENLRINNVSVVIGDGSKGLEEYSPFDTIMVTAGVREIPKSLVEQLKEGGRMVIPLGESEYDQYLLLGLKKNGEMRFKNLGGVRFVPLIENGVK